jgi:hypothetical protein
MSAFASMNTKSINAAGPVAFENSALFKSFDASLQSNDGVVANEALEAVKSLCEDCDQWIEPYVVEVLPYILEALAFPKTKEAATHAGNAILKKSNSQSVRVVTAKLYESFSSMKWQTKKVIDEKKTQNILIIRTAEMFTSPLPSSASLEDARGRALIQLLMSHLFSTTFISQFILSPS